MDTEISGRHFWISSHFSLENLFVDGKNVMPPAKDLLMCFPVTLLLILIRYLWERNVIDRWAKCRVSKMKYSSKHWNDLKKLIGKCEADNDEERINYCLKESLFSRRQVERYLRDYSKHNLPGKIKKIRESGWQCTFYSFSFVFGLWCLYDKEWFTDPSKCWIGWPLGHLIPIEIYWYYVMQLSFYLALTLSIPFDVKRKDSLEMFIHHVLTISLLLLSYCDNFYRIGSMILILHDPCDIFLHLAKLAVYFDYERISVASFGVFSVTWLITRIIIFPYKIVMSCIVEPPGLIDCDECALPYVYYIFSGTLCLLQALHIIWFYLILKTIRKVLIQGDTRKDYRSESESNDSSNEGYS